MATRPGDVLNEIAACGMRELAAAGNLYMQRVGARATLTRITVLWGLVTMLTCMVSTPAQLYIARFALGVAEAVFFPGVILYLTYCELAVPMLDAECAEQERARR